METIYWCKKCDKEQSCFDESKEYYKAGMCITCYYIKGKNRK